MTFEFWLQLPVGAPGASARSSRPSSYGGNFLIYVRPDFESKGFATIDLFTDGGEAGVPYPDGRRVAPLHVRGGCVGRAGRDFRRCPAERSRRSRRARSPRTRPRRSSSATDSRRSRESWTKSGSLTWHGRSAGRTASYNNQKSGSTFLRRVRGAVGYHASEGVHDRPHAGRRERPDRLPDRRARDVFRTEIRREWRPDSELDRAARAVRFRRLAECRRVRQVRFRGRGIRPDDRDDRGLVPATQPLGVRRRDVLFRLR